MRGATAQRLEKTGELGDPALWRSGPARRRSHVRQDARLRPGTGGYALQRTFASLSLRDHHSVSGPLSGAATRGNFEQNGSMEVDEPVFGTRDHPRRCSERLSLAAPGSTTGEDAIDLPRSSVQSVSSPATRRRTTRRPFRRRPAQKGAEGGRRSDTTGAARHLTTALRGVGFQRSAGQLRRLRRLRRLARTATALASASDYGRRLAELRTCAGARMAGG
jgi:hypothetical protein